ncbi:MAG TPA: hypothetical protein DD638_01315 [Pasteurellaceae bacterium]|nr:hypothetical protein [Pasteurellaceae bacterium]
MNKLIKFGAAALLAIFVTACGDKADPAADFKKLSDWSAAQQQSQLAFQTEFQKKVATQDPAQIEEALKDVNAKVAEIEKSLDALDIKSPEIKTLKDKMKSGLMLSNQLVADGLKIMQNPTDIEAQKVVQEKVEKVQQEMVELQKLQMELQQKYGAAK